MTQFVIADLPKWVYQNRAQIIDGFEGVLLDNAVYETKRGLCFIYEHAVNPNQSEYVGNFIPYRDREAIALMWAWWEMEKEKYESEVYA